MHEPDSSRTYVLGISGGKDSTALWIYLQEVLGLSCVPVFADTVWEDDLTYEYLDYLEGRLGKLYRVTSSTYPGGMVDLAQKKGRFPSARARFCTEQLKLVPVKRLLDEMVSVGQLNDPVQCSGVRAEESPSRAAMAEWVDVDTFFKLPQWRPILYWSWKKVFALHKDHGIKSNPLYKMGMGRVGCMPCVMNNHRELYQITKNRPGVFDKVTAAEHALDTAAPTSPHTFWHQKAIPNRHCSIEYRDSGGTTHRLPSAADVNRYIQLSQEGKRADRHQTNMFAAFYEPENEDVTTCSSIYGLCE